MSKVYVFLADGTEEVEALTAVDLLRRAGAEVVTVSVMENRMIRSSHQIGIEADEVFGTSDYSDADMLVLPGGMPGTLHLKEHPGLQDILRQHKDQGTYLAAICAAPSVFGHLGFLNGKRAVCYPGFEEELAGAFIEEAPVVQDGTIITSKGLGTAIDFSLQMITALFGAERAKQVLESVQYRPSVFF